ncbi:fatty acid desaturase family protein [Myxococcus xanthus]|uniref:Fatty acid desaturase n=1 Tax=Myxococcus xanthus TaxID=34 RepID=A0A7Y4IDH9_MYXXA|nr:fatty acid desaturase [Myxococcus xanthus]NOJ77222.1 fatty acid desaturase [Myxococcus xanthus]NOJ87627.1 fatty acid desaturase [Myxococcus xanthus]
MTLFRHPRDRIPVLLFTLVFALDLTVFFTARSWWFPILWLALGVIPKGWISAWNHHHQHVPMFRHALPNRLLEVIFGFQTGVTSHAWFLHHVLGHHRNYLDQTQDESGWKRRDGSTMGEVEYSVFNTLVAYPRAFRVGRSYPKVMRVFLAMGALQVALLGVLFWHDWYNALWVFLLPMAVSLYVTVWATYFHHVGLEATEHTHASYNILHKGYNLMTGNLGYHTAHHAKHGLHWSQLPELHAQLSQDIPATHYRQPGIPFVWTNPEAKIEPAEAEFGAITQ